MMVDNSTNVTLNANTTAFFEAALILTMSLIGIFFNVTSTIVLICNRTFRNSFGRLTTLHTIANTGLLAIFAFWVVPLIIINDFPSQHKINHRIGQFAVLFQQIAFITCFFISFNRLSAIAFPSFYRRYFTDSVTKGIIAYILVISVVYSSVYFVEQCDFHFDADALVWDFSATPCGKFLAFYVDLISNISIFAIILMFDCTTLLFLRGTSKALNMSTTEVGKKRSKEIRFFIQALANTLVYSFMLVCFHIIVRFLNTDFLIFLSTTGVWCFAHACGGVILVAFNREIQKPLKSPRSFLRLLAESTSTPSVSPINRVIVAKASYSK